MTDTAQVEPEGPPSWWQRKQEEWRQEGVSSRARETAESEAAQYLKWEPYLLQTKKAAEARVKAEGKSDAIKELHDFVGMSDEEFRNKYALQHSDWSGSPKESPVLKTQREALGLERPAAERRWYEPGHRSLKESPPEFLKRKVQRSGSQSFTAMDTAEFIKRAKKAKPGLSKEDYEKMAEYGAFGGASDLGFDDLVQIRRHLKSLLGEAPPEKVAPEPAAAPDPTSLEGEPQLSPLVEGPEEEQEWVTDPELVPLDDEDVPPADHRLLERALYVTDKFGEVEGRNHKGTDYRAKVGETAFSLVDGVVLSTGHDPKSGNWIKFKDDQERTWLYAHLNEKPSFVQGDKFQANDAIGITGATGKVSGPHLHIQVKGADGNFIDPESIINTKTGGLFEATAQGRADAPPVDAEPWSEETLRKEAMGALGDRFGAALPKPSGLAVGERALGDLESNITNAKGALDDELKIFQDHQTRLITARDKALDASHQERRTILDEKKGFEDDLKKLRTDSTAGAKRQIEEMERVVGEMKTRNMRPIDSFGFFTPKKDANGNPIIGKNGVPETEWKKPTQLAGSIATAIGLAVNAYWTIGSEGKVPFIAWDFLELSIEKNLEEQEVAAEALGREATARNTLYGKFMAITKDTMATKLATEAYLMDAVAQELQLALDKAKNPTTKESIQLLQHRLQREINEKKGKMNLTLLDGAAKLAGSQIQFQRGQETFDEYNISKAQEWGRVTAAATGKSDQKTTAIQAKASKLRLMNIEILQLWDSMDHSGSATALKHLASISPDTLAKLASGNMDTNIAKMAKIRVLTMIAAPITLEVLGEVGNKNNEEQKRAVKMYPWSEGHKIGRWKILTNIGFFSIMSDPKFLKLSRGQQEAILKQGISGVVGGANTTVDELRDSQRTYRLWDAQLRAGGFQSIEKSAEGRVFNKVLDTDLERARNLTAKEKEFSQSFVPQLRPVGADD